MSKITEVLERLAALEAVVGIGHNGGPPLDDDEPLPSKRKPGLLPDRLVAQHYEVSVRTLERWDKIPNFDFPRRSTSAVAATARSPSSMRGTAPTRARRQTRIIHIGTARRLCPAPALGALPNLATLKCAERLAPPRANPGGARPEIDVKDLDVRTRSSNFSMRSDANSSAATSPVRVRHEYRGRLPVHCRPIRRRKASGPLAPRWTSSPLGGNDEQKFLQQQERAGRTRQNRQ